MLYRCKKILILLTDTEYDYDYFLNGRESKYGYIIQRYNINWKVKNPPCNNPVR